MTQDIADMIHVCYLKIILQTKRPPDIYEIECEIRSRTNDKNILSEINQQSLFLFFMKNKYVISYLGKICFSAQKELFPQIYSPNQLNGGFNF